MRALGAYSEFMGTKTIAGHDVPQMIGKMAQVELDHGGKTWAQLYAAMALECFGTNLKHNALWQGLSSEERQAYLALLDPGRFYDSKNHKLIHLPKTILVLQRASRQLTTNSASTRIAPHWMTC